MFVIWPLITSIRYSLYSWDGVTPARWVGLDNYKAVFSNPTLLSVLGHAFQLIIYFSLIPVSLGLVVAAVMRRIAVGRVGTFARTVLFLPQVVPLVAAGIAWSWVLSANGAVNQMFSAVGLGGVTRAWLGDFTFALPAVGVIGVWVLLGFCTVLLLVGMNKIDPALYEASELDGAGPIREFFSITLPSLRQEIGVCVTVTVIAALSAFDIVYIATSGGPGDATMVPGLEIYQLAFYNREVGLASALAVVLMLLVPRLRAPDPVVCEPGDRLVTVARGTRLSGAVLLIALSAWTLLPFASLFTAALHHLVRTRAGLAGLRIRTGGTSSGVQRREHGHHFQIERLDRSRRRARYSADRDDGRIRARSAARVGGRLVFVLFLLGLTLPFEGIIVPLYYEVEHLGFLDTRWAIILPLVGLFMPFGVFWMRAHFVNMPNELTEAASSDGATTWQQFWGVQVPLARPAIVSLAILTTVWTWNQFLLAMVLVNDPADRTMAGALGAFQGDWGTNIPLLSAGSLLILAPMILIYCVFQRHFIAALLQGCGEGLAVPNGLRISGWFPRPRSARPFTCPTICDFHDTDSGWLRWRYDYLTSGCGTFGSCAIRDEHHVFYLQAPRALGGPELRHRHASVGHAVSRDLRDWRILRDALGPGAPGSWDDLAIWTGSAITRDRRWYMLYTGICSAEEWIDPAHRPCPAQTI